MIAKLRRPEEPDALPERPRHRPDFGAALRAAGGRRWDSDDDRDDLLAEDGVRGEMLRSASLRARA